MKIYYFKINLTYYIKICTNESENIDFVHREENDIKVWSWCQFMT